ncbi:MAG: nicotinate-nucleotide diphosphorylase (carboxylating) [Halobacteriovoraceae bacterium]|nr:nicotinate-nucleotide diphosphorylase (carboxylating) [Halobacteriovoraceae bacterium]
MANTFKVWIKSFDYKSLNLYDICVMLNEIERFAFSNFTLYRVKMNHLNKVFLQDAIANYYKEDDLHTNFAYVNALPQNLVKCSLKFKQDIVVAGMPYFVEAFNYLHPSKLDSLLELEGKSVKKGEELNFDLPFNIALTGERIALNLLQRASAVATYTKQYVDKAKNYNIKILDTRKTTPGHRALEKYAVFVGGGFNHRFGQMDCLMIKDNHKSFFGGLENALKFFEDIHSFYRPVIVEIHDLEELKQAQALEVKHLMLDNFSPSLIKEAIRLKQSGQTFEVSGCIRLETIQDYLIDGVDAISVGALTYDAPHVDISLKYKRI